MAMPVMFTTRVIVLPQTSDQRPKTAATAMLPDAGIVLSTREPAELRDGLFPLGITQVSAGSHTEPGGKHTRLE